MTEVVQDFLHSLTGNSYLTVALISMFPLVELKGAIPVGESLGLALWQSAPLAYVGSTLIALPIFFLLIPVFNLMKRWKPLLRLTEKIEGVFERKAAQIAQKHGGGDGKTLRKMLMWGVYIFVAVPLPMTGVWTGTAICVFLGLRFRESVLPIVLGNFTAGSIITLLTFLFKDYVEYIILGLFACAIVMLIVFIIKVAVSPGKKERPADGENTGENT